MHIVEKILLIFTFLLIISLNALLIDDVLGEWGGDNASYLLLAKSIISGIGYREIFTPGLPPHTLYPPVFPLLLSPVIYLWGYNFWMIHTFVIITGFFAILVARALFEEYSSKLTATCIALLTGINPIILAYQQEILSEIPYLLFSLLSIYFIRDYLKKDTVINRQLVLTSLSISLAYLTRTIGITIYFACIFYIALKIIYVDNKVFLIKKGITLGVLSIIPNLLWLFRNIKEGGISSDYISYFFLIDPYTPEKGDIGLRDIFFRINNNLLFYQTALTESIITFSGGTIILSFIVILLVVFGLVWAINLCQKEVSEIYVLFYIVILLLSPFEGTGGRYIVPMIPFIYLYIILAIKKVSSLLNGKYKIPGLISATLCLILLYSNIWIFKDILKFSYINEKISTNRYMTKYLFKKIDHVEPDVVSSDVDVRSYVNLSAWLRENSKDSDIIACRKPSITALISERQAVAYPFLSDENKIIKFFENNNISYIIVDSFSETTYKYLIPVISKHPERFNFVRGNAANDMIVRFVHKT